MDDDFGKEAEEEHAPAAKKQRVRVSGPASWLTNAGNASVFASALGGDGASLKAMVVKVDAKRSDGGTEYSFVMLMNIDKDVEVTYRLSNPEKEEYKRFIEYNKNAELGMPNPSPKRPPWVWKVGTTITVTVFRVTGSGFKLRMGSEVFVSKGMYSIGFSTDPVKKKDPGNAENDPFGDNGNRPNKFKRNVGDPYMNFTANLKVITNHAYDSFRSILSNSIGKLPVVEDVLEYPEESRIPGVGTSSFGGMASSFVPTAHQVSERDMMSVMSASTVSPVGLKCAYNVAMIPNDVLFQKAKQTKGVWIEIHNPIYIYDQGEDGWQIPDGVVGGNLPIVVMKTPATMSESAMSDAGKISGNYTFTKFGTEVEKVCIKDDGKHLLGSDIAAEDKKLYYLSPIYACDTIFGVSSVASWQLLGAQVFRSLVSLCFISVNADETNALQTNSILEDMGCSSGIAGAPILFPDYRRTFSHAGLRVSREYAFKVLLDRRNLKDKEMGESYIRSDYAKDNQFSAMVQGGLEKPPVVCLREFTGMLNMTFLDREWDFVMVPPYYALTDDAGNLEFMDEAQTGEILRKQGYHNMNSADNCCATNEKYIQENWMTRENIRNMATIMAVYKF